MKSFSYELLRGFAFRKIKHHDLKPLLVTWPIIIVCVTVIAFIFLPVKPSLFGVNGLTSFLIPLISILPGFFIAALAAIATFDRPTLDQTLPDPAPTIELRTGGELAPAPLTMRLFLSYMFAYLTALSFTAAAICVVSELLAPSVSYWIQFIKDDKVKIIVTLALKALYLGGIVWLIANIIIITLYGIYFLIERMHRPHA